jgi:hypothetical protein
MAPDRAMLAAVLAVSCVASCASTGRPGATVRQWENTCYAGFSADMHELAGPDAIDCGFSPGDSRGQDGVAARLCARRAYDGGGPFLFGYGAMGDDSYHCDVAIRDGHGQVYAVFVDTDVTGQYGLDGGGASLQIRRCDQLEFKPRTWTVDGHFEFGACTAAAALVDRFVRRHADDKP